MDTWLHKAKKVITSVYYPIGVGVNICCDLQKKTFTISKNYMIGKTEWREKYLDYLKSKQWKEIRIELLESRGNKCEKCLRENVLIHVHHLTYKRLFNEDPGDLMLLCIDCHDRVHSGRVKKYNKTNKSAKKTERRKTVIHEIECPTLSEMPFKSKSARNLFETLAKIESRKARGRYKTEMAYFIAKRMIVRKIKTLKTAQIKSKKYE